MKTTIFSLTTAAVIGLAALAPSQASAKTDVHIGFGIYGGGFGAPFGGPGYYGGPGYDPYYGPVVYGPKYHQHCKKVGKKKWTPGGWKWKKVTHCWTHEHY